jgi:hypothetical protein
MLCGMNQPSKTELVERVSLPNRNAYEPHVVCVWVGGGGDRTTLDVSVPTCPGQGPAQRWRRHQ